MANPKHDYDSDQFYALLERCASVCYYDKEVAVILDLDEDVFGSMKNGNYANWSKEQNKRRSERINRVLTRARAQSNMQAWNTVLRVGLGKYKSKSRSIRATGVKCTCGGRADCLECGGSGYVKSSDPESPVIITETETELAPSLQAVMTWLYHHDENYRRVQRGEEPITQDTNPIDGSVSIQAWIRREMEATDNATDVGNEVSDE